MSEQFGIEMSGLAARLASGLPLADVSNHLRTLAEKAATLRQDNPPEGWVETFHNSMQQEPPP